MGCNESKDVQLVSNREVGSRKGVAGNAVSPQKMQQQQMKSSNEKSAVREPIKFTHFGDGGRCEPLLMLFTYGNIQYENEVIKPDDWEALKPKTVMGTLPIMKVGSEELVSSLAMLTYLSGEAGLEAATAAEQAAVESIIYMVEDCRGPALFLNRFLLLTKNMDEETRIAKAKEYTEGPLAKLSAYLESQATGSTWLLPKLSAADFWLYGTMKALTDLFVPDAWSLMGPKVQQWKENFENMPQIKEYLQATCKPPMRFTYFDGVRGRVEPYRMIFAHTDMDCEEEKVAFAEWPALKPQTPMGYLPVLHVGDEEISSSLPVLKYVGMECGLHGGAEEATCDTILYTIEDCRTAVFPHRFLLRSNKMDDEAKQSKADELVEKTLPPFMDCLEEHITGDKWLLAELSVADFWLYGTMETLEDSFIPDIWSRVSPRIQTWRKHFEALPKVKAYLDSRPKDYTL